ncbi:tyrosine-type recombinase/integrase [Simplicispira psychrophila]|uniref:tyrosine-type recombinase/integrase n=1 Tax=Simplicispira psychrophila TaxID=80882 RepID=UPI000690673D|nr:integrase arm-type DNA-binding domain-containing protein [Simplicispira psychrophila]
MALSDTFIKSAKHSGKSVGDKHSDGQGLYLHIKAAGKYWRMAYRMHDKQKTLSIGVYPAVSLAQAREARKRAKEQLAQGVDPSTAKQDDKHAAKVASTNTYEAVAREFHQNKASGWSEGHARKWLRMNELYLFPELRRKPLEEIKTKDVLAALQKVEAKGTLSTAHDLQQMAGQVLRYAVQTGRIEQNPAPDLRGALRPHIAKHFAAVLEPEKVAALLRAMDSYNGSPTTKIALRLAALFFQRPGNIRAMEWTWIDLDKAMLTIPPASMKRTLNEKVNGRQHHVPLAKQAIAALKELQPLTGSGRYVFPGARSSLRPMSDNTINAALKRMDFGSDDHVGHGFRAMARTMIAERMTGIDADMVEAQLGHGKKGALGGAYDRAEYMEQRRAMMQTWADYLDRLRVGAEVIPLVTKVAQIQAKSAYSPLDESASSY